MRNKRLVQLATLLALLLLGATAHSVIAYDPPTWPQGLPWGMPTVMPWPTARPLSVGETWSPPVPGNSVAPGAVIPPSIVPQPVVSPVPLVISPVIHSVPPVVNPIPVVIVPQPTAAPIAQDILAPIISGGSSPANPINPTGSWQLLESGANVWYRIGTGGVQMQVFLDTDPPNNNVTLSIYAPGQLNKPIGKGTPYTLDRTRLVWNGGHWNSNGDWLAVITNYNPMAVRYKITSSAQDISNKTCHSYWEKIGNNPVYWTICD